jgi:hypothetical protein
MSLGLIGPPTPKYTTNLSRQSSNSTIGGALDSRRHIAMEISRENLGSTLLRASGHLWFRGTHRFGCGGMPGTEAI